MAGPSKWWSKRRARGIASSKSPCTIACAVMAARRWPAPLRAASRRLILWYARPCAIQARGGRMADTALVIVARYPQPGATKTRLAKELGNEETAQLYRAFLRDLAHRFAEQPAYDLHWAYTPAGVDYAGFLATLAPSHAQNTRCFPQRGEDFGERLLNAFRETHAQGYRRTVLIGSDSPHIDRDIITRAIDALDNSDVVL